MLHSYYFESYTRNIIVNVIMLLIRIPRPKEIKRDRSRNLLKVNREREAEIERFRASPMLSTVGVPRTINMASEHPCLNQSTLHTPSIIKVKPRCLSSTYI